MKKTIYICRIFGYNSTIKWNNGLRRLTMAISKIRSIGYYTTGRNTGVEYAIREDGAVFSRACGWSSRAHNFTKSKWMRDESWEDRGTFKGLPKTVRIGFAKDGCHMFVDSTKLRLPQDVK